MARADHPAVERRVASVQLTGVASGAHALIAVFMNANGETVSKPVKVTVK